MNDKIFTYGIPIGLIVSATGLLLLKMDLIDNSTFPTLKNIYNLTLLLGILLVFFKSSFVSEKLHLILKVVGVVFVAMVGLNLLNEFGILEIEYAEFFSSLALLVPVGFYVRYFLKKDDKSRLDYLKVSFVVLSVLGLILNSLDLVQDSFRYVTNGLFWIVVLNMLFSVSNKEIDRKKYAG